MPSKFFSTGQVCSTFFLLLFSTAVFAQLDWNNDVVVFGTEWQESEPLIVAIDNYEYRAVCLLNSQTLRTRRSLLHGEAWSTSDDLDVAVVVDGFGAIADNLYAYVWSTSGSILRIPHSQTEWLGDNPLNAYPEQQQILDTDLFADTAFDSVDTFMHGISVYIGAGNDVRLGYFRSEDRAQSIAAYGLIDSSLLLENTGVKVTGSYTWSGENERLWAAVTLDRPGTIGEQIALYHSDDLGATWSIGMRPDSSSYAQLNPKMIGHAETLMLAYQRRNSTSIAHDIYMVYSPDNGISWSEPLQLTDHSFDDTEPDLATSGNLIGIFYARAQIQQSAGQLLFRQASLDQPWAWEPEEEISEADAFIVTEGYSSAGSAVGFAAVWTGRLVGEDTDVFFDASWRGTSVDDPRTPVKPTSFLSQNPETGRIEYVLPLGTDVVASLYDLLGRRVNQSTLSETRGIWSAPENLPSGTYWLTAQSSPPLRIQVTR